MAAWNPANFGCIERAGFRLRPINRTAMTALDGNPPTRSKKADVAAPLEATFQTTQTAAQFAAFTQWHKYDLAGGARPFEIDLWLWGQTRRVRARFLATWKTQRDAFNTYRTAGSFEIERESIT